MKKLLPIVILLAVVGAGGAVFYANRPEKEPTVNTLQVSRGDIIDGVGATGTLQAVRTVTVGTQVSGIVQELYADFNSIVKQGQIVARLACDVVALTKVSVGRRQQSDHAPAVGRGQHRDRLAQATHGNAARRSFDAPP